MEDRKFEIIKQLMEELQDEMQPNSDDFSERLGREKPSVEVMKMSGDGDDSDMDSGMPMDDDDMMQSPDDKLKSRLMKLRG